MDIIITIVVIVVALVVALVMQAIINRKYDFLCKDCGARFSLPLMRSAFTRQMAGRRYVKCPKCGKKGYADRVPKKRR